MAPPLCHRTSRNVREIGYWKSTCRLYTVLTIRTIIPREFPLLFRESKLSIASTRWQCPSRADLRKNIKRERADGTALNKLPHCFIFTTNSNNNNNVHGESSDCKIISFSYAKKFFRGRSQRRCLRRDVQLL